MSDSFSEAIFQLHKAGGLGKINKRVLTILSKPQREITVSLPPINNNLKIIEGYRIQYNNALGPYKGGIRFHPEIDKGEVKTLALLMTLKTALFKLPLGGGKGGVVINPKKLTTPQLKKISENYAKLLYGAIGPNVDIPAPDVYTNPTIMKWMMEAYGKQAGKKTLAAFTGKPLNSGGSLGRTEATGYGALYTLNALTKKLGIMPNKLTVAIQGFGNAGYYFAIAAYKVGFKIVAISDSKGGIYDKRQLGMDPVNVFKNKQKKGLIQSCYCADSDCDCQNFQAISNQQLLTLPVDIIVPAALGGAIVPKIAKKIKARIVVEIANDGITSNAQKILDSKKIITLPDILANAGGVIVSYFEYQQNLKMQSWTKNKILNRLKKMMTQTFIKVWLKHRHYKTNLRTAAWIEALKILEPKIKKQ